MRGRRGREKVIVNITLPPEQKEWLDSMVKKRTFDSRSHGVEVCIIEARKKYEK